MYVPVQLSLAVIIPLFVAPHTQVQRRHERE
jgi:hypothetical protein